MKPLFIDGADTAVTLDGPALVIERPLRAPSLVPIQRIDRVVSGTEVSWQTRALIELARSNVPVIFIDRKGRPIGRLVGRAGDIMPLPRMLQALFELHGTEGYRLWLESRRNLAAPRVLPECTDLPDTGRLSIHKVRQILARQIPRHQTPELHAVLHGWVLRQLATFGIGASTPWLLGNPVDLPTDLTDILEWQLLPDYFAWCKRNDLVPGRRWQLKDLANFALTHHDQVHRATRELISALHAWAASQLETAA